jgi:hypothetical protein
MFNTIRQFTALRASWRFTGLFSMLQDTVDTGA